MCSKQEFESDVDQAFFNLALYYNYLPPKIILFTESLFPAIFAVFVLFNKTWGITEKIKDFYKIFD